MQRKLEREGHADEFRAASAGAWTMDGRPATQSAILVMAEMGVDIRKHHSRVITEAIMDEAVLILVMTHHHGEALRAEFPARARRVRLFSEMAGSNYDIEDPVGGTMLNYEETALELEAIIENGYLQMLVLASR